MTTLIAEVGCNHKGQMSIAKQMIDVITSFCEVQVIKFQKRTVKELLTEEEYNRPHPDPDNAYGATYGAHREALEFSIEQHAELKAYCELRGATYACSVWDLTAAKEILSLNPAYIKIPSAMNTNHGLLTFLCQYSTCPLHISLGMTTRQEEFDILTTLRAHARQTDAVIYACTSGYPIEAEDACLLEIRRLKGAYVKAIGYSGHHNGISLDIAAATLGASYIERHFTLSRVWKGTDHAASLEPDGLRRLQRNLIRLDQALTYKKTEILPIEQPQRDKLKWKRT